MRKDSYRTRFNIREKILKYYRERGTVPTIRDIALCGIPLRTVKYYKRKGFDFSIPLSCRHITQQQHDELARYWSGVRPYRWRKPETPAPEITI